VIPVTEFRTFSVFAEEPADRTSQGTVAGEGDVLDLGEADATDEARNTAVRVVWWRVSDLNGAIEVRNIRAWLEGASGEGGSIAWHMDITDAWTRGKTPVQVETGTPGDAPTAEGEPNLARIGGGPITGLSHDQTSRYIYLSARIGVNAPPGKKSGIRLRIKYDFR